LYRTDLISEPRSFARHNELLQGTTTSNVVKKAVLKPTNEAKTRAEIEKEDDEEDEIYITAVHGAKFGCVKPPIIDIDHTHQVPDPMHGIHRIGDKESINMINDCMFNDNAPDGIYKANKHPTVHKFLELCKNEAGLNINPEGYTFKDIKNIFRSLTGDQRKRVMAIDIKLHFQGILEHADLIGGLWEWFNNIVESMSKYEKLGVHESQAQMPFADFIDQRTKLWCDLYTDLYGTANVTPYIHRFSNHLGDHYRRHGNIYLCHLQGMENSNQVAGRRYTNGNNKQRVHMVYLKQLIKKSLRIAVLEKKLGYFFNCKGKKVAFNFDGDSQFNLHEDYVTAR
jgi:hypothetical protein